MYCGRNILPSLFLGMGYEGEGRSIAISALSEYRRAWNPDTDGLIPGEDPPPSASAALCPAVFLFLRFIFDRLGSPKSSPSSSSYSPISSASAFQSSLVVDRKLM